MIKIDPSYKPAPIERKDVFGITFEQGRNEIQLNGSELFANIPTQNKTFLDADKRLVSGQDSKAVSTVPV